MARQKTPYNPEEAHYAMLHLQPTPEELDTIFKAAVVSVSKCPRRGAKTLFPAPVDFIDAMFGHTEEDEPVWDNYADRKRATELLRTASVVGRFLRHARNNMWAVRTDVKCPICDRDSIQTTLGFGIKLDRWNDLVIDPMSVRLLHMHIKCPCGGFNLSDFDLFEELAKENAIHRLRG